MSKTLSNPDSRVIPSWLYNIKAILICNFHYFPWFLFWQENCKSHHETHFFIHQYYKNSVYTLIVFGRFVLWEMQHGVKIIWIHSQIQHQLIYAVNAMGFLKLQWNHTFKEHAPCLPQDIRAQLIFVIFTRF